MKRYVLSLAAIVLPIVMLAAAMPARAQQPEQPAEIEPGVGRVSYIHGDVSSQVGDSDQWNAATLNTPVSTGDRVATGKRSRAEVQLDYANVLRMADESTANITNLTRTGIQVQVGQGLVTYDVLRGNEADIEIDTPNVAIRPQMGEGSYRILVNPGGETIIDVRKGSAEIVTPQGSTRVNKDQRITIQGTDNAQYQVSRAIGKDDWDKWNSDRTKTISNAESWKRTNRYYTGSQDLDAYGHWTRIPDYDYVWIPAVSAGWAPYRTGRWVYEPYYGWTWVSYEPWGWAPYHYGRWMVYGGNWAWWPGPVYRSSFYRPIWAPAYVSFFGFGGGGFSFGVNVGFGNYGWLPIGPADPYYPWYGRGRNRVNVVNVTNINIYNGRGGRFGPLYSGRNGHSNINRAFNDDRVRSGFSSMPSGDFGRGRVPERQQRIDAGTFRQTSVMTGAHPASPGRESFRSTDRQVNQGDFGNRSGNSDRFFSRSGWSGASRSSGAQQRGEQDRGTTAQTGQGPSQGRGQDRGQIQDRGQVNSPARGQDRAPQDRAQRGGSVGTQGSSNQRQRPGWRGFGSGNSDSGNSGSRNFGTRNSGASNFGSPGNADSPDAPGRDSAPARGQQRDLAVQNRQADRAPSSDAAEQQRNSERPGWRSFGSGNSGGPGQGRGVGRQAPARDSSTTSQPRANTPADGANQRQQNSGRAGWRTFNPPSEGSQSNGPGGPTGSGGPGGSGRGSTRPSQDQGASPRSADTPRQSPFGSTRNGNSGRSSRPPLEMGQQVVRPRNDGGSGSDSTRGTARRGGEQRGQFSRAPSGPGSGGGQSYGGRGSSMDGGNRGGSFGGGSRGGFSGGGQVSGGGGGGRSGGSMSGGTRGGGASPGSSRGGSTSGRSSTGGGRRR